MIQIYLIIFLFTILKIDVLFVKKIISVDREVMTNLELKKVLIDFAREWARKINFILFILNIVVIFFYI